MKVDLGCGREKREGFVGVDLVEQDGVDIVCDVVKDGLPFMDGEVELLNTSHFLEHLGHTEVAPVLKDCYRVLKNGGAIEILVPDLLWCLEAFLQVPEAQRWGFPIATIYGHQAGPGEVHKTGFTKERLMGELMLAGFTVKVCMPVWSHKQRCILARAVK